MSQLTPDEWRHIALTREGGVTEAILHQDGGPLVWNARIHRELVDFWTWLSFDRETKVVILGGAGDRFCTEIEAPSLTKTWHELWWEMPRIINGRMEASVPVISVVNGPVSIHSELPVLGDIVLATDDATFSDRAHTPRGFAPADGVHLVWRNLLGPSRSSWFLLTGAELTSQQGLDIGFVHEIHPRESIYHRAHELAGRLATLPGPMLAYTCTALRMVDRDVYAQGMSHGLALQGMQALAHLQANDES